MYGGSRKLLFELLNAIEDDDGCWRMLEQLPAPIDGFPLDAVEFRLVYLWPYSAQFQRCCHALGIMLGGAVAQDAKPQFGMTMIVGHRPALFQQIGKRQLGDLPWLVRG